MKFLKHLFSRFGFAMLMAIFSCGVSQAQDSPASLLTLANKQASLAKGQPAEEKMAATRKAIDLYQTIPKKWPEATKECARAHLLTGALEQRLGNTKTAMTRYEDVLKVKDEMSTHADALLALASLYRKQKSNAQAVSCLNKLIADCSEVKKACAKARLNLGSIARQEKRYIDAMQFARDVLDKHENLWRENVDAVQLYLSILIKCRRWDEARKEMNVLDAKLKQRFAQSERVKSVNGALAKISARRMLTPVPVSNN
ncbi:MAG: tetratricopeptide (TPR) repeat protein [Planctomycetota bacterium]|jgi:tetratricopeptide (TPR) repeat protein